MGDKLLQEKQEVDNQGKGALSIKQQKQQQQQQEQGEEQQTTNKDEITMENSENNFKKRFVAAPNSATSPTSATSVTITIASVQQENEKLKQEIIQLKTQLAMMQQGRTVSLKKAQNHHQPKSTVIIELPPVLKNSVSPSSLCCARNSFNSNGGGGKQEHSTSTLDDQETIEPDIDLEAHESGRGLHQRIGQQHDQRKQKQQYLKKKNLKRPLQKAYKAKNSDEMNDGKLWDVETNDSDDGGDDDGNDDQSFLLDDKNNQKYKARRSSSGHDGLMHDSTEGLDGADQNDNETFWRTVCDRAGWLVGLLVLQSMSSFILSANEATIQKHSIIVLFLTMLVGAGGNAGNQASVRVIRGIAIGKITDETAKEFLNRELYMGVCLSCIIGVAGCIRAAIFLTPFWETIAITSSLFLIVIISIILGAVLPLIMKLVGIDPAHSSTTIQVIMDILGVTITVHVCSFVLDAEHIFWHQMVGY